MTRDEKVALYLEAIAIAAEDGHERIAGLIVSIVAPSVKDFIEIR